MRSSLKGFIHQMRQLGTVEIIVLCFIVCCFLFIVFNSSLNFQWAEFQTRVVHTWFHRPVTTLTCDGVSLGSRVVHMLIWFNHILASMTL